MARCGSAQGLPCGWFSLAGSHLQPSASPTQCAGTLADGLCEPVQEEDKAEGPSPPPRTGAELKKSFVGVGAAPGSSRRFSST